MGKRQKPAVEREAGLYKNGNRWWIRLVRSPISLVSKPLSAGTDDLALANAVLRMVLAFAEDRPQWEWLDRAVRGEVKLLDIYNRWRRGDLAQLATELAAAKTTAADATLDAVVAQWLEKDLKTRADCRPRTKADYERQVRYFIPAACLVVDGKDVPNPLYQPVRRSEFTDQYVRDKLAALGGAKGISDRVQGGTQRNYLVGLQQFVIYGLRSEALTVDPLRFAFGKHGWAAKRRARSVYHEHPRVVELLSFVHDPEAHAALALIYGSGIELSGLLNQKRMHFGTTLPDGRGKIVVPGQDSSLTSSDRKNDFRSERTIFVDAWAWRIVKSWVEAQKQFPKSPLWSYGPESEGKALRDAFYRAQVDAGFIDEPPRTDSGKFKWSVVNPHRLHDIRHSFCVNRSLGLDGELPRSAGYCARQLGHASEQMVVTIYKKAGIEEQVRTLELRAAMDEAARLVLSGGGR